MDAERRLAHNVAAGKVTMTVGGRSTVVALRTQVIDAEVARALGHGTGQIVLLGAGYDGRPFRFGGGAVHWFEVDRRAVLADKWRRLNTLGLAATGIGRPSASTSRRTTSTPHSTRRDTAPRSPSLFVCEALLDALTLEVGASLYATLPRPGGRGQRPDGHLLRGAQTRCAGGRSGPATDAAAPGGRRIPAQRVPSRRPGEADGRDRLEGRAAGVVGRAPARPGRPHARPRLRAPPR